MPIRVLIVDDQHLFAESLRIVLHGASDGKIEVVGVAGNGQIAVDMVAQSNPEVILMDIRMPVMDGVEATSIIHREHANIRILILTTFDDDELAVNALSAGANGYVLKGVDPSDLVLSIESVSKGAFYISPSVGFKLIDLFTPSGAGQFEERELLVLELIRHLPSLTRREAAVLYLAAKALTNKEIANELGISEKTAKNHLSAIYEKLGIHKRLELINYVHSVRHGGRATM